MDTCYYIMISKRGALRKLKCLKYLNSEIVFRFDYSSIGSAIITDLKITVLHHGIN